MHRRLSRQDGQGLIEFAIVFPLFVFFLFAVFEVGLGLNRQATLQHAVREGARVGALLDPADGATVGTIEDKTIDQSQDLLNSGDITVSYDLEDPDGCAVDVHAVYHFEPAMLSAVLKLVSGGVTDLDAGIDIDVTGSARIERKVPPGDCT